MPTQTPAADARPVAERTLAAPAPERSIAALVAAELGTPAPRPGGEGPWLENPPRDLFGLALSGGGIRSATFNLGLLQGLERIGLLGAFDYQSTVSGGGYVGAFWTAWRSRAAGREGTFPSEKQPGAAEPREIRHLREFSNFLVPRLGLFSYDTGRLLVTAIGAMVPSVLASLSVIALGLFAWLSAVWLLSSPDLALWVPGRLADWTPPALILGGTAAVLALFESGWRRRREPPDGLAYPFAAAAGVLLTLAAWWALWLVSGSPYQPGQLLPGLAGERLAEGWAYVFAPAASWAAAFLVLIVARWFASLAMREPAFWRFRRATDRVRSRLLFLAVAWTVVASLWLVGLLAHFHLVAREPLTSGGSLGATAAALAAAFAKVQQLLSRQKSGASSRGFLARLRPVLPQLLAYALVLVMVVGVVVLYVAGARGGGMMQLAPWTIAGAAGTITLLVLGLMDPNEVGLHSFYRSRLVRAYAGASNLRRGANRETEVVPGDDVPLDELVGAALRPFPLVCCAANDLTSRDDMANLSRGATSAVLSPVGCAVDGVWAPWEDYRTPPTLGGAMTASGAAFNTLMGSVSKQLGPGVTFIAATLNLRLGLWVPHPCHPAKRRLKVPGWPFYLEMFGVASAGGPRHVHLSDGGHFENMAVYELIRRHCRVILASDCGQDGAAAFDDLGNLVRRVREDFGVDVRIDTRPLRPGPDGLARQQMVAGDIHYPDGDTGVLLLFKPVLVGNEPADVLQYRTRNAGFPNESTGDQFYDEAQWESYRRLGDHAVRSAFAAVTEGLDLRGEGRTDAERRETWSDAFARARREWFPEPEGFGDRLSRFGDRVAELDAMLAGGECALLRNQVYKELDELERQPGTVRVGVELPLVGEARDGTEAAAIAVAAPARSRPSEGLSPADLSSSLYLIRRALLLMEELFHTEDLARNYGHPLYLGVMNWCARWAYAPLFRMWWPLLKSMYPQPFTRFLEQQFSLRSVERPGAGGDDESLVAVIRPGGGGFAEACWRRQGHPEDGREVLSYHLRMFYEGRSPYEVQAAQVRVDRTHPAAVVWEAGDFFVPPGLWGVGIGSDFLRLLRGGRWRAAGDPPVHLVVRVASDPCAGSAGKKRAADEMHLYRANGFHDADPLGDRLVFAGGALELGEWAHRPGEAQWLVAEVRAPVGSEVVST